MTMTPAAAHPPAVKHGPLPHRQLLGDSVYEAVKTLVMDHVLTPGARVSIDAFARELAVSPTPLREALARLESDGLVRKEPMRGYSVTPLLTSRELEELYELRALLEPWGARHAAMRATAQDHKELDTELDSFPHDQNADATSYAGYRAVADHDARLHGLVLRVAGNDAITAAYERTRCHLHLFRLYYNYRPDVTHRTLDEHRLIVTAIRAGDADEAEHAMRQHILLSRDRMAGILHRLK